jgi:hypothetical protein
MYIVLEFCCGKFDADYDIRLSIAILNNEIREEIIDGIFVEYSDLYIIIETFMILLKTNLYFFVIF